MTARISASLMLTLALAGCGDDASAQDPIDVSLEMLPCSTDAPAAGEPWESAPWPPATTGDCTWFPFDGGQSYRFAHALGRTPRVVLVYVSFDVDGRSSNVAPGDATRIVSADANMVEIRNGTTQDFFAKVVLE